MATKVTLTNDTIKAGQEYVLADGKAGYKLERFVDLMWNDGVRTATLTARGADGKISDVNDALRGQVKETVIVPAFPKTEREILEKETKSLDDLGKFQKSNVQKKIGVYMSRFEKKIQEREEGEMIQQGLADPKMPKTDLDRYHDAMDNAIRYLNKLENPSFDVVTAVKNHKALKGSIPSV